MLNQAIIPFHDDKILLIERDGEPFVAVKPICERLGLDWKSQWAKLRSGDRPWGMVILGVPSAGGEQETVCLPLRKAELISIPYSCIEHRCAQAILMLLKLMPSPKRVA